MRRRLFNGRVIALLTAYLIAFQGVMLPLSLPPMAAAFAGSLCVTAHTDAPSQHPARHDQNCPCCAGCGMQCHQPGLADGMPAADPIPRLYVVAIVTPERFERPALPGRRLVQQPRAPPVG
jgi:hypothetical protein